MGKMMMCFKDKERPCDSGCMAHNKESLGGTRCIELASQWNRAKSLKLLGESIGNLNTTVTAIVSAAMRR